MCSSIEEWKTMGSDVFAERRTRTDEVVQKLASSLEDDFDTEFDSLIGDHTCIYATGSCGRGEMGPDSDLDAYVIRVTGEISTPESRRIEEAVRRANKKLSFLNWTTRGVIWGWSAPLRFSICSAHLTDGR